MCAISFSVQAGPKVATENASKAENFCVPLVSPVQTGPKLATENASKAKQKTS